MSYTVETLYFEIANLTIFRTGTYKLYLSIARGNNSDIVARSIEFDVVAAAPDRLLFTTASGNVEETEHMIAGDSTDTLQFHVVDDLGNFVFDLLERVTVVATGQLSPRAEWLEDLLPTTWVGGQAEAEAVDGLISFDELHLPYAGIFTLHFTYGTLSNSINVEVVAGAASQISLPTMPTTFKIAYENLATLPGMPYYAAVLDSFNNTIDAHSINVRLAEIAVAGATYPASCGDFHQCKAELCIATEDGDCNLEFSNFDANDDGKLSTSEYAQYADAVYDFYYDVVQDRVFADVDRSSDGYVSKMEFQLAGIDITKSAPFFQIDDLRIKLNNEKYMLIFSWGDLTLETDLFDVEIGHPFAVDVTTRCPEPPAPCGQVGQFLEAEFEASLIDAVGNLYIRDGVPIHVSIPDAYTTPGAYSGLGFRV